MTKYLNEKLIRENIPTIIKCIRDLNGITQQELSRDLAISQSYVSKLEKGIQEPSSIFWYHFCQTYNIPWDCHIYGFIDSKVDQSSLLDNSYKSRFLRPIIYFFKIFDKPFLTKELIGNDPKKKYLFTYLDNPISGLEFDKELYKVNKKYSIDNIFNKLISDNVFYSNICLGDIYNNLSQFKTSTQRLSHLIKNIFLFDNFNNYELNFDSEKLNLIIKSGDGNLNIVTKNYISTFFNALIPKQLNITFS